MKTIDLAYDYSIKPASPSKNKKYYPQVQVEAKSCECEIGDKVVLIGKVCAINESENRCSYSVEVQKFVKEADDLGASLDRIIAKKHEKNEQDEY